MMPTLISKSEMLAMLGVSRNILRALEEAPGFPAPIYIGKRAKWREEDIIAWVAAQ